MAHQRALRISSDGDEMARREAELADAQAQFDSANDAEPSEEDLLKEMQKKACGGNMKDKKKVLREARNALQQVGARITQGNAEIGARFVANLPSVNKLKDSSNELKLEVFAANVLGMWKAMEEFETEQAVQSTGSWIKAKEALEYFIDLAKESIKEERMSHLSSLTCKPSHTEKACGFLINGYKPGATDDDPTGDEALCFCLECLHPFVDCPNTNKDMLDRNAQKSQEHQEKLQEHLNKQAERNAPKKRKPKAPKLEEPWMICHCHQMHCMGMPDGPGNKCPWKCRDPETKQPFGKDANGVCLCPICKCKCSLCVKVCAACVCIVFLPTLF